MRFLTVFTTFICIGIFAGTPSQAQDINAEGAERLKTIFEDYIALQADTAMTYNGDVVVEQANGYFAVTLPELSIEYSGGEKLTVGIISVNAVPHDAPDLWHMSVALPTPFLYRDDDETLYEVHLGEQTIKGVWHEAMRGFVELNARVGNVKASGRDDDAMPFTMDVGSIMAVIDMERAEDPQLGPLWSGPVNFALDNFSLSSLNGEGPSTNIGKIIISSSIEGLSEQSVATLQESAAAVLSGVKPDPQALQTMFLSYFDMLGNDFSFDMGIENVRMERPSLTSDARDFLTVGKVGFGMSFSGLQQNIAEMGLRVFHDDFDTSRDVNFLKTVMPQKSKVDLGIVQFPMGKIRNLAEQMIPQMMNPDPSAGGMMFFSAMMQIPVFLSEAGTELRANDVMMSNDLYAALFNGAARPDLMAARQATADGVVEVNGLDRLVAELQRLRADGGFSDDDKAQIQSLLDNVALFQNYAETVTGDAGQTLERLKIELNKAGEILLNGQSMQPPQPEIAPEE